MDIDISHMTVCMASQLNQEDRQGRLQTWRVLVVHKIEELYKWS